MKKAIIVCMGLIIVAGIGLAAQNTTADRYTPDTRIKLTPTQTDHAYVSPVKHNPKAWHIDEGFEGTWPPTGWVVHDVLDPSVTWTQNSTYPHTGTYSAYCYWSSSVPGEDWLVTPQIAVQNNDTCYFWFRGIVTGWPPDDTYLMLSTTDNLVGSFTVELLHIPEGSYSTTYAQYAVDLSAYAGQNVYLGFKNANTYGDGICIDDVLIGHEYTPVAGDLALQSIDEPSGEFIEPGLPFAPAVTAYNPGTSPVSDFYVVYSVDDGVTKALVYEDTVFVNSPDSLFPDSVRQFTFDDLTPLELTNYYVTAYVAAPGDPNGFNDTLTHYFRTFDELVGNVTDDNNGGAPVEGATITAVGPATYNTTTNVDGDYSFFDMTAGTYTVTASKSGYTNEVVSGVTITDGAQTTLDMSMGYPDLVLSPTDSIYVTLPWEGMDNSTWQFTLENVGSRDMTYNASWPELTKGGRALGDSLWGFTVNHIAAVGVEVAGGYIYVTSGGASGSGDANYFLRYDLNGNRIDSIAQGTTSTWGLRDMCFDGTYIYGSDENTAGIRQYDPATGAATGTTITVPGGITPARALAYNPINDHFYTANWASNIVEFDRNGTQINSWANTLSLYGLACDPYNPAGPSLWAWSQDGSTLLQATRFDLTSGTYGTETFAGNSYTGAGMAGGATFSTELVPGKCVLLAFYQDDVDRAVAHEIRDNSVEWLDISPASGTVSAYGSENLAVTFDAAGLDSFTDWAANVTFSTNAPGAKRTDYVPAYMHVLGLTGVTGGPTQPLAYAFGLNANRPNPVNGRTNFSFTLPKAQDYALRVYNITGQMVASFTGKGQAGPNNVAWNTGKNGAGVYFYQLASGGQTATRKLVVIK